MKAAADVADERHPVEKVLHTKVRGFIELMIEEETALSRPRYGRRPEPSAEDHADKPIVGHRHGHRMQSLTGTFGPTQIAVPRASIIEKDGKTTEMEEQVATGLSAPHPRPRMLDRIDRSLRNQHAPRAPGAAALFGVGKDTISRDWRKVKGDWDAWNARSLKDEPPPHPRRYGCVGPARQEIEPMSC